MSIQARIQASIAFPVAIAAGTDEVWYWTNPHPGTWKVESIYFTPGTARTADPTNYTTYSVKNEATEIATADTTAVSLVLLTPIAMTLSGTGSSLEVAQGDTMQFLKTDAGTGLALDGSFEVSLVQVKV